MPRITYAIMAIAFLIAVDAYANRFVVQPMVKTKSESCSFPRLGPYRIHGKHPDNFRSFYEFQLKFRPGENQLTVKYKQDGSVIIDGELYTKPSEDLPKANVEPRSELTTNGKFCTTNVVKFRFETATLRCEADNFYKLDFTTETIHGIHYSFKGLFLKKPKLVDGMYIHLAGRMMKHQDGRKSEKADLNFVNWSSE